MSKDTKHKDHSVTAIFRDLESWAHKSDKITMGELVKRIGERGLGLVVVVLSIPFLQPVPMFGLSSIIGAVVMVVGVAIFLDREPWLPKKISKQVVPNSTILSVCSAGKKVFGFTEKFIKPRGQILHKGSMVKKTSGAFIFMSAVLLALPIPIPGTNMPPAAAMFFLSLGFIERDGYVISFGYLCFWATVFYFGFLAWASYKGASYALPFLQ